MDLRCLMLDVGYDIWFGNKLPLRKSEIRSCASDFIPISI